MRFLEGSVYVLSGEELTLPSAEVFALVGTYSKASCERLSRRVVVSSLDDDDLVSRVAERASYVRFGGRLLSIEDKPHELASSISSSTIAKGKSFAVASESLDKETFGEIGGQIKSTTGAKVSLEEPDYVFQAEKLDDARYVLGMSKKGIKKFSWRERRPRARRFFLPSAIYPKLARLLVNLSRVKEGEYFLDPFCGTGSLLIECSVMGIRALGIDITRWIAKGAALNLKGLKLDYESIVRADSTNKNLPFARIDAIATDIPYGRASSTKGKDPPQIATEFLASASLLNSDKYCVLMHPSSVQLDLGGMFELTEQHFLYVHRNLTRAISVLRRR